MVRIDIHTHLAGPGAAPNPSEMDNLIRLARRHHIERAVALGNLVAGFGAQPSAEGIRTVNDNTLNAMKAHPEFFIGFCYVSAALPADFMLDEIERCLAAGMRGLKFWVALKATDRRHDPLMQRAEERGVPILYHAWYKMTDQGEQESTPAEIADLARRWPRVPMVMAHLTGDGERGVLDILDCPNVLIDTSGGQSEAGLVEYAVRRLGAERVVYGSDWPIRDFGVQTGRVLGAGLSDAEYDLIFHGNAERILKL